MSLFVIDKDKCRRDGCCTEECPLGLIEIKGEGAFPSSVEGANDLCVDCGHCVTVCPAGALSHRSMKPEDCPPMQKQLLLTPEHAEHFLRSRRSIRNYKDRPVDRAVLTRLIEIARFAPSGHNLQPVHWLAVQDSKEVKRLAGLVIDWMRHMIEEHPEVAGPMHFDRVVQAWERGQDKVLRGAPHIIVAHGLRSLPAAQPACIIALTYLELAATALGLGACWAGYFNAAATSYPPMMEALALPKDHQSFGTMMVGYPKYHYQRLPLRKEPNISWR
jgi:nitroreductase/NAD-dependent dihydropyrimidine dehydrogenase PreA subunit